MEVIEELLEQMSSKYSLAYSSSLKMEAVLSFETLADVYQTTWRHITEDNILHVTAARTSNITELLVILI
jgi:hypothetical protein